MSNNLRFSWENIEEDGLLYHRDKDGQLWFVYGDDDPVPVTSVLAHQAKTLGIAMMVITTLICIVFSLSSILF